MKQILFTLMVMFISGSCFSQVKSDNLIVSMGLVYQDSHHRVAILWDSDKWEIKDTMGLINVLKKEVQDMQKLMEKSYDLHAAARQCLLHMPNYFDKSSVALFDKYLSKYHKLLNK